MFSFIDCIRSTLNVSRTMPDNAIQVRLSCTHPELTRASSLEPEACRHGESRRLNGHHRHHGTHRHPGLRGSGLGGITLRRSHSKAWTFSPPYFCRTNTCVIHFQGPPLFSLCYLVYGPTMVQSFKSIF